VLQGGGLHPLAVARLDAALKLVEQAQSATNAKSRSDYARDAFAEHDQARNDLLDL